MTGARFTAAKCPQYPSGGGGSSGGDWEDGDNPRRCAVCGGTGEQ